MGCAFSKPNTAQTAFAETKGVPPAALQPATTSTSPGSLAVSHAFGRDEPTPQPCKEPAGTSESRPAEAPSRGSPSAPPTPSCPAQHLHHDRPISEDVVTVTDSAMDTGNLSSFGLGAGGRTQREATSTAALQQQGSGAASGHSPRELSPAGRAAQQQQQQQQQQNNASKGPSPGPGSAVGASTRSSFAKERMSMEMVQERLSQARNSRGSRHSGGTAPGLPFPVPGYEKQCRALVIIPPDTPAPLSMLAKLWSTDVGDGAEVLKHLTSCGILRCVTLSDGSLWAMATDDAVRTLAGLRKQMDDAELAALHAHLVDAYAGTSSAALAGLLPEDDGYIVQHLPEHLMAAGSPDALRELLMDPLWIEGKLHAYGVSTVVADYRRYLRDKSDSDVKTVLQAFQLSLSQCLQCPAWPVLRAQMLARLTALAQAGKLKEWHEKQTQLCMLPPLPSMPMHLVPRTASLKQAGSLQRMTMRGHAGPIRKALISPNGQDIISISDDGTAQVWDMNIGDVVMKLSRDQPLTDIALTMDGLLAVVACADGSCCIWDVASGAVKASLKGHLSRVTAVAVDKQGIACITVGEDASVRVWSMATGRCECVLSDTCSADPGVVSQVVISSDGVLAATASDNSTCSVWDLDEGEHVRVLEGHTAWVSSVAFVGTTATLVSASHDTTARVWDAWTGRCLRVLHGHEGRINKVVPDAGGTYIVTCSDDNTARVWDVEAGTCAMELVGHQGWVNDAAWSRDATKVVTVSGDHTGRVWDVATGRTLQLLSGHTDDIPSVCITHKGRFVVTGSLDNTARVWDLSADDLSVKDSHGGTVQHVVPVPGGKHVLSTGEDGLVMLWDVDTGACVAKMAGHTGVVHYARVTPDGSRAATGSGDRKICVWELPSGKLLGSVPGQPGSRVKSMAFDAEALVAAVVLFDSTFTIYNLPQGEEDDAAAHAAPAAAAPGASVADRAVSMSSVSSASESSKLTHRQLIRRGERDGSRGHSAGVNLVLVTADGAMAVTASKDNTVRLWDIDAGCSSALLQGHNDSVEVAVLSPDEMLLATGSYDKTVRVSTMPGGELVQVLQLPAAPLRLVFSPSGWLFAAPVDNHNIALWDLRRGTCVLVQGHTDEVLGCVFSEDSGLLASFGRDATVRVWGMPQGELVAIFMADAPITSACFAGTSGTGSLVAGDANGVLHFLAVPPLGSAAPGAAPSD